MLDNRTDVLYNGGDPTLPSPNIPEGAGPFGEGNCRSAIEMAGAPKGNKNALKHGLYAEKALAVVVAGSDASWRRSAQRQPEAALARAPGSSTLRDGALVSTPGSSTRIGDADLMSARPTGSSHEGIATAIRYLEEVMDEIMRRMKEAEGSEEFTRLANALSLAATSLFNGHRTVAYLTGGASPVEEALRELQALDFNED
jgi:hypothetical protein